MHLSYNIYPRKYQSVSNQQYTLLVIGMYLKIYRLCKISRNGKTFREHEKNLVNVNNNVGYDLKMNKYNPILLKRIFLHSFLSFSFAYFTKNHCYYVTTQVFKIWKLSVTVLGEFFLWAQYKHPLLKKVYLKKVIDGYLLLL